MGRITIQNEHFNEEIWKNVNKENKSLLEEFKIYLHSIDRADTTIHQYDKDLKGFFCWYCKNCGNKEFFDIKKRDIIKYQNYLLNDLKLSSNRIRRMKSTLSSLSNYIVNILDDDYPEFKNIILKIEAPQKNLVREKTIITDEQLNTLLTTLIEQEKYITACYFAVLASSGMRKSEVFRLKLSDFSKENKISNAIYKSSPIKTKGRGKSGKVVPKFFVISMLEPYLSLWLDERKKLGIDNEYLFANTKGKLSSQIGNYYCEIASKILGVNIYSHSLRHYLTSYMCKHNIPNNIIKEYFQWNSLEMINIYDDNKAEDNFGDYFSSEGIKKVETKNLNNI